MGGGLDIYLIQEEPETDFQFRIRGQGVAISVPLQRKETVHKVGDILRCGRWYCVHLLGSVQTGGLRPARGGMQLLLKTQSSCQPDPEWEQSSGRTLGEYLVQEAAGINSLFYFAHTTRLACLYTHTYTYTLCIICVYYACVCTLYTDAAF